jgi:hypothetical protein
MLVGLVKQNRKRFATLLRYHNNKLDSTLGIARYRFELSINYRLRFGR